MNKQQSKQSLNFKQAILNKQNEVQNRSVNKIRIEKNKIDENERAREESYYNWLKTIDVLSKRWEKYKEDYIQIYGEDEYEKRYVIPNYWVMPEDEEEYDEESEENESDLLSINSYDEYSDYDSTWY
jgi:hypothetical protein